MTVLPRWIRNWIQRRDPVIHLYCLCWNEARMLPFFFLHYDPLVTRYFVFDNGSTDGSRALLASHPRVTLGDFQTREGSLINEARAFYDTVWHPSRGTADWILIVNIDEHLHHPAGLDYFQRCIVDGITAIVTTGFEMVSERFPAPGQRLSASITMGIRSAALDKLCAFRPDSISRLRFGAGRHKARPKGSVVYPHQPELQLLHYKHLSASYVVDRYAELSARISASERERGWAAHYFKPPDELRAQHAAMLAAARPVPGLDATGAPAGVTP